MHLPFWPAVAAAAPGTGGLTTFLGGGGFGFPTNIIIAPSMSPADIGPLVSAANTRPELTNIATMIADILRMKVAPCF